jgi:hypothetical protein
MVLPEVCISVDFVYAIMSNKSLFPPCLPRCKSLNNDHTISPLLNLADELLFRITSVLDVRSLSTVRQLCSELRKRASCNEAGWTVLCHELWKDKVHVLDDAYHSVNAMEAYRQSLQDARERQHLTSDELCYDEVTHSGTIWSFRFKEAAGPDWTSHDPWHNGMLARKMVFLLNGSVKHYTPLPTPPPSDLPGTQNFEDEMKLASPSQNGLLPHYPRRLIPGGRQHHPPGELTEPPLSVTWRFLNRPVDLPSRPLGSYIRLTVGGRDIPTYVVRRSPTGNWGFLFECLWGVYASFELPLRLSPSSFSAPPSHQRHAPFRSNNKRRAKRLRKASSEQLVLVSTKNNGSCDVDDEDNIGTVSRDDACYPLTQRSSGDALLDDSEMLITNVVQWREAYLYNWGANVLPEKDSAISDDSGWSSYRHGS